MPRGKRPLTDLKDSQYYRRVKVDPLSILLGDSQSDLPAYKPPIEPEIAGPVEAGGACDVLEINNEIFDCGSDNYVDEDPISQNSYHKDSRAEVHQNHSAVEKPLHVGVEGCVKCLLCLCFENCFVCKHDLAGCHHCKDCVNGDVVLSDYEPESTDDEDELCVSLHNVELARERVDDEINDSQARDKLAYWASENGITQEALRQLLKLLNECYDAGLPKDPRTLMQTPRLVHIRPCPPGLYWHAGLEKGLQSLNLENFVGTLEINFGADGIPLSRSSGSSFWPILCSVPNFEKVILVGAYHGNKKPNDANDFMREFVDELNYLCKNGLTLGERKIPVCGKCLICDAQAKTFLLYLIGVTGYYSCTKCMVKGEYVEGRVVFPQLDAPLRTDADFRSMSQIEHHNGVTIITEWEQFDLIKQVPLDWMHLVHLGIVRKTLHLFKSGKLTVRFQSRLINEINQILEDMRNHIPNDFVRKTRSLEFLKQFKATELRTLILYVLPVALIPLLKHQYEERYKNLLILHVALTIMVCEHHFQYYGVAYAEGLCRAFVQGFLQLYGKEQASHNIHNLIHLPQDVANHGVLENFSAYKFENFLQELKKLVRKGEKPLQQLARRHMEAEEISIRLNNTQLPLAHGGCAQYSGRPLSRCTLPGFGNPQYYRAQFKKFTLDVSPANRYCGMSCGAIVEVHHIATHKREMNIVGKYFKSKIDFYDYPLPSSHLGIYRVSDLSELTTWPINCVRQKYIRLPFEGAHVVFPILHTV